MPDNSLFRFAFEQMPSRADPVFSGACTYGWYYRAAFIETIARKLQGIYIIEQHNFAV
jgi:hypothetical protein